MQRVFPGLGVLLLAVVALGVPTMPALADEGDAASAIGPNVEITLRIEDDSASGDERSYFMLARDGGGVARLLMGWRVPIPKAKSVEGESDPSMEFVYQNVGFTADVAVTVLADRRILVRGQVEASGAKQGPQALRGLQDLPIIGTFQQDMSVVLQDGETVTIAEVPDPEGGRLRLELTAKIQNR